MSTIDSYTLVAGANLAYDIYRPLRNPGASDRELVHHTRIGIVVAWAAGFGLAFLFDRVMALWVFMATGLSSMVLVPILMALFWKGRKVPLAGVLSSVAGLVSMIVFYVVVAQLGVENDTYGTYIWSVSIGGTTFDLWQEYALFFTLPTSFLGFVVGTLLGRRASDHKEGSE
jgi:Na+/proline symporter